MLVWLLTFGASRCSVKRALLIQCPLRPQTAYDLVEIMMKTSVDRGYEPLNNPYQSDEKPEIGDLPGLVGL